MARALLRRSDAHYLLAETRPRAGDSPVVPGLMAGFEDPAHLGQAACLKLLDGVLGLAHDLGNLGRTAPTEKTERDYLGLIVGQVLKYVHQFALIKRAVQRPLGGSVRQVGVPID